MSVVFIESPYILSESSSADHKDRFDSLVAIDAAL
jgi:hypothetical protein